MGSKTLQLATLLFSSLIAAACSAAERSNAPARSEERSTNASVTSVPRGEGQVQIRVRAGATTLTARLEDSAAARDFAALLPLQLTLKDYASTEKIANLPRKLSTEGAPDGVDPDVGDIAYYAPWGNLAVYYRDFGYSRGLVRLGRIESGAQALASIEGPVSIEAVEQQRPWAKHDRTTPVRRQT